MTYLLEPIVSSTILGISFAIRFLIIGHSIIYLYEKFEELDNRIR
jgi:uncharacterized membrane protein HdeD (DUF308 family)